MTSSELAKRAGISQAYVIEIEMGKKNPSLEVLARLAKALDVSLSEIISGIPPQSLSPKHRYIPVINRVSCGEWLDVGDLEFPPGFGAAYELTDSQDPNAFYVIAEGDSMVGGRIHEGDYLLVSPNLQCNPGDIVLAKSDRGITVKRFMKRGAHFVLEPLNPAYKSIHLKDGAELKIYRIVEIKIKL
jgi:SOS-response transcriptional repressor LexA